MRFELLHRTHHLGISERRSQWIINWAQKIVDSTSVNVSAFEEGLGRVVFVAEALEYERPFLYRYISIILEIRSGWFQPTSSSSCLTSRHRLGYVDTTPAQWKYIRGTAPRVDAQGSEGRSVIGGGALVRNTEGELDPWLSPWFSNELTRKDRPWIYERGDRPSLVISTLEASVVLISLK